MATATKLEPMKMPAAGPFLFDKGGRGRRIVISLDGVMTAEFKEKETKNNREVNVTVVRVVDGTTRVPPKLHYQRSFRDFCGAKVEVFHDGNDVLRRVSETNGKTYWDVWGSTSKLATVPVPKKTKKPDGKATT